MNHDALMEPEKVNLESSTGGDNLSPRLKPRGKRKDGDMMAEATILEALETPQLVREMLGRLATFSPTALRRVEREYKLSYYYGGLVIAGRETSAGFAVVFSGPAAEVAAATGQLPREQAEQLTISTPDPIEVHLANLPQVECALS